MKRDILILLLAAVLVLLVNLGSGSLSSWDEAFYAQVSREILQNNNWIDLTWGGLAWSDKPPLYMWATACFYNTFGINEFSTRFFSALAGILTIIITYLLALRIFSRRVAFLSGIMLLSTYHFIWFSKMGTLDVTFTAFAALSFYFFLLSEKRKSYLIYSFVSFSLAFMTKGTASLLIPMILGLYVLVNGNWKMILNRYTVIGVLFFLFITASWYFTAFLHYGRPFLEGHFLQNLVHRTTSTMDSHSGNWLTYINVVLYKGKPWGPIGLAAFPFFVFWTIRKREAANWLLVLWISVFFIIFTVVRTKLHWYIMPVYPAICIIAGWGVERILKRFAVISVIIVSMVSLFYFGIKKDIFTLDYNPALKSFSQDLAKTLGEGKRLYLYNIHDPGAKFYLGKNAIYLKDLGGAGTLKDGAIVMRVEETNRPKGTILIEDKKAGYIVIVPDNNE